MKRLCGGAHPKNKINIFYDENDPKSLQFVGKQILLSIGIFIKSSVSSRVFIEFFGKYGKCKVLEESFIGIKDMSVKTCEAVFDIDCYFRIYFI